MPHYRTMLTSDNFMAADLWSEQGKKYIEIVVQIAAIKKGEVVGERGRKKGMPFVTMKSARTGQNIPKPLGLNATNCQTIAGIVGTPDLDRWIGVWITLYVTKTDAGPGEKRDCIRIKPEAAKAPTEKRGDTDKQIGPQGPEMDVEAKRAERAERAEPKPGDEFAFDPEET